MNDRAQLLRAVLGNPADDTVRLAYADALDENGLEPGRAELIRVQVELEGLRRPAFDSAECRQCYAARNRLQHTNGPCRCAPRLSALLRRASALIPTAVGSDIDGRVDLQGYIVDRGFVSAVATRFDGWATAHRGEVYQLFARSPVTTVVVSGRTPAYVRGHATWRRMPRPLETHFSDQEWTAPSYITAAVFDELVGHPGAGVTYVTDRQRARAEGFFAHYADTPAACAALSDAIVRLNRRAHRLPDLEPTEPPLPDPYRAR